MNLRYTVIVVNKLKRGFDMRNIDKEIEWEKKKYYRYTIKLDRAKWERLTTAEQEAVKKLINEQLKELKPSKK